MGEWADLKEPLKFYPVDDEHNGRADDEARKGQTHRR